jgi:hypothetical protein
MSYIFKQAASFGPGLKFNKGHYDKLPDTVLKHHYFALLKKSGLVVDMETANGTAHEKPPLVLTPDQQKRVDEVKAANASQKADLARKSAEAKAVQSEEKAPTPTKGKGK